MKSKPFAKLCRLLAVGMFMVTALILLSGFTSVARAATAASQLDVPFLSQYQGQVQENFDWGSTAPPLFLKYYHKAPGAFSDEDLLVKVRTVSNNTDGATRFVNLENALHAYLMAYSCRRTSTRSPGKNYYC